MKIKEIIAALEMSLKNTIEIIIIKNEIITPISVTYKG